MRCPHGAPSCRVATGPRVPARRRPARCRSHRCPLPAIVYDLAMTTEQIDQWASEGDSAASNRSRAAAVGRRGGIASVRATRGDNVTPHGQDESSQVARADSPSPHDVGSRGDNDAGSGVTTQAVRVTPMSPKRPGTIHGTVLLPAGRRVVRREHCESGGKTNAKAADDYRPGHSPRASS